MMPQTSNAPTQSPPSSTPERASAAAVWARVNARGASGEVGPTSRLAGLSLVARHARMAARAGWQGAVFQVEADAVDATRAALAAQPPPAGFEVEVVTGDAPAADQRRYVAMTACAVYTADALAAAGESGEPPQPFIELASRRDIRSAERQLVRMIRKSVDADGVVSYYAFRPISRLMTRILIDTPVNPNHVSLAAMAFGIAAAICASFGGHLMFAIAGGLYWIGAVVDCVDGELARLRLQGSKLGEWLDTLADDVSSYGLLAGVGVGMWRVGYDPIWLYLSCGAAVLGFLLQAKLYADLHRWGMTIDTAQYPWFYGTPSQGEHSQRGFWGKWMYAWGFLFRRDAFVTVVAVLLILYLPRPAIIGSTSALGLFVVIFITHIIVMTVRGDERAPGSPMKWSIGYFGVKDLFTIINLMGGVFGIYFALEGNLEWAGYSIFAGYILGDALDGPVARWSNTSNKFGGEFDAAADHVAQAIAPAVMLYVAFTMGGHQYLGLGLMALFMCTASIRQARFNVADFNYPLTYCGLPRTVSGLIAISLPNSLLFFKYSVIPYEGIAAVLAVVALLNLCPVPYMTHKGKRKMQPYVKLFVMIFLSVPALMVVFAREFVYDLIFFITFGYALTAWIPIYPEERREFWAEYKRWSAEVAAKK